MLYYSYYVDKKKSNLFGSVSFLVLRRFVDKDVEHYTFLSSKYAVANRKIPFLLKLKLYPLSIPPFSSSLLLNYKALHGRQCRTHRSLKSHQTIVVASSVPFQRVFCLLQVDVYISQHSQLKAEAHLN